jgi:hypothetical protein
MDRNYIRFMDADERCGREFLFNGFDAHTGYYRFGRAVKMDADIIFQPFYPADI